MIKKVFITILILTVMIFSINVAFAENFTDLNHQINDNDYLVINEDIVLNQNEADIYKDGIPISNRQIEIDGNGHAIVGKDSNSNQVRIFNIEKSNVTLSNMIISSAAFYGSGGAVILDRHSNLILNNVTFRDNSALGIYGEGGALYSSGHIYIYNCTFENNYASGAGGAVYSRSSSYINASIFKDNSAKGYGGGIFSSNTMDIDSSSFKSNKAYSGGAFHYTLEFDAENEHVTFNDCNFISNEADYGAAVSTSSFIEMTFNRCNCTGNNASRGGVFYKGAMAKTFIRQCLFENNTAEMGAVFYEDSFEGFIEDFFAFLAVWDSTLKNNHASEKASVFYGKSSNFWVNNTIFNSNADNAIYNGIGNITVMNSRISNCMSDFITQFLGGNIILVNNTWDVSSPDYDEILSYTDSTNVFSEVNYTDSIIDLTVDSVKRADYSSVDLDCCSIYVRINQTDFAIAHRRDGGKYNFTQFIEQNDDYIRYFKPTAEYFFLTKVYTNGWVIGTGGWDDAVINEKIEAIASDMVKNEYIDPDVLDLILRLKEDVGCGHLLIVAPDGTYGNVLYHESNNRTSFFEMGVLEDNTFIISPNGPDYRTMGSLDDLTDPVEACVYLASTDEYGFERHSILVHHIRLNESGFSDSLYLSNEDGHFINQNNEIYADSFWFKEELTTPDETPLCPDYVYIGTFYDLNRTIISQNVTKGYNSGYVFKAQFLNRYGDFLANESVDVVINGKSSQYTADKEGVIEIAFDKLTETQNIVLTNPLTGEVVENTIEVVSRLAGEDIVMHCFEKSKIQIRTYDEDGNPAGENQVVTIRFNNKIHEIKTDSDGIATFAIPEDLMPGTYTLEATYAGQTINNTIEVIQNDESDGEGVEKSSNHIKSYQLSGKIKNLEDKSISLDSSEKNLKMNNDMDFIKDLIKNIGFDKIFFLILDLLSFNTLIRISSVFVSWLFLIFVFLI